MDEVWGQASGSATQPEHPGQTRRAAGEGPQGLVPLGSAPLWARRALQGVRGQVGVG